MTRAGLFGRPVVVSDDGGYSWFQSPRALLHGRRLVVGSVASGAARAERRGSVEVAVYDLDTGESHAVELHRGLELDDHDSPAILRRPDGRWLALYAKHDAESHFYHRVTPGDDPRVWDAERIFTPSEASRVTYGNLCALRSEGSRIYDFYRGLDGSFKPSYAFSDDLGESWVSGNVVIDFASSERQRPYVVYASNGDDAVHLVYSDAHPRDYDNGLHHVVYREGALFRTDGVRVAALGRGLASPSDGSTIFRGGPDAVAGR